MSDKKYLFKRNNVWWVKLAVPLSLRSELGYDLRKSTGEKDLEKALPVRDKIVQELSDYICLESNDMNKLYLEEKDKSSKIFFISDLKSFPTNFLKLKDD